MIRERSLYDFWILFISVVGHGVCSVTDRQPNCSSVYICWDPAKLIQWQLYCFYWLYWPYYIATDMQWHRRRNASLGEWRKPWSSSDVLFSPPWHIRWLAVVFLAIEGTKWLRCLTMLIRIIWWVVFQKHIDLLLKNCNGFFCFSSGKEWLKFKHVFRTTHTQQMSWCR